MDTSSCSVSEETLTQGQVMCNNTPRSCARASKSMSTPIRSKVRTPRSCSKTPTEGDRFIPARDDDLDIAHFYLTQKRDNTNVSEYVSALEDTIFEGRSSKILSFKAKAPAPHIHVQNLHTVYPPQKPISPKKYRHISPHPTRVLDAPGYADDFYLNVLDWGQNNILAVGLGDAVYLWNASTADIKRLPPTEDHTNPSVTSLAWLQGTNYISIGTDENTVQIWDVERGKKVREMGGHSGRVATLSWSGSILSSGSRDTTIINHDVRIQDHHVATLTQHTEEVCGLKWNIGGTLLASGGNDNVANIWDVRASRLQRSSGLGSSTFSPLFTLPHSGAVKALAWCPFQASLLATGGGSSDRCIRFFNSSTGGLLNSIDTTTQVCQLLWSTHYRELVSAQGFSDNNLVVWRYPSMQKVTQLSGHSSRVLSLALSPDGETCVSAAADETLRFWQIFERESKSTPLASKQLSFSSITNRNTMIR